MCGSAPPDLVPFLWSLRTWLCAAGLGGAEPARFLGVEDTPALVEKTFPADSVGAVVAGSPDNDLSPPARRALPGVGAELEIKFVGAPSPL